MQDKKQIRVKPLWLEPGWEPEPWPPSHPRGVLCVLLHYCSANTSSPLSLPRENILCHPIDVGLACVTCFGQQNRIRHDVLHMSFIFQNELPLSRWLGILHCCPLLWEKYAQAVDAPLGWKERQMEHVCVLLLAWSRTSTAKVQACEWEIKVHFWKPLRFGGMLVTQPTHSKGWLM